MRDGAHACIIHQDHDKIGRGSFLSCMHGRGKIGMLHACQPHGTLQELHHACQPHGHGHAGREQKGPGHLEVARWTPHSSEGKPSQLSQPKPAFRPHQATSRWRGAMVKTVHYNPSWEGERRSNLECHYKAT
ncbi:hypothetical protein V6N12_040664 [Hibiscus sabdariffa]|uniref:Uncharacterized protein n=1 Tax=Hibiscus sabdariffa TaxID=183260 RepID=A0ABR2E4C5_9ROSI